MPSTLTPKQTDADGLLVIAPDIVLVAPAEKSGLAHDAKIRPWDAKRDARPNTGSDRSAGPSVRAVDKTLRAAAINAQVADDRPSMGKRAMRAFIGFLLAVCIGVAATVWQAYGDTAKQLIANWAPKFGLTSSSPPETAGLPEQSNPPTAEESAANAAALNGTATFTTESAQLLQSVAGALAHAEQEIEQLKASVAQLKAGQQQMPPARASDAKPPGPRAFDQNRRPRISVPPRRAAAAPVRRPVAPLLPPRQAATAATLPQTAALSVQLSPEQPQATAQPLAELAPRPPMPLP
jgi:hypothetical protein